MDSGVSTTRKSRRPQLERISRLTGLWLRVAVGIGCIGCAYLEFDNLRRDTAVSRADVVALAMLLAGLAFVTIPSEFASRLRQKAIVLAFGIAIAGLLVEGFIRVFEPFPILLRAGRIDLPVNVKKQFSSGGVSGLDATVSVEFNSLGFRGPEPPEDWSERLTIICVGGSTTQCIYLSDGETWPDQLAIKLHSDVENVWVNNAGIDGHSTFGHLELLDQYLAALRPKILLFYVGLNDVERNDLSTYEQSTLRSQARWDDAPSRSLQRFLLRRSDAFALFDNMRLQWLARQKGLKHGEPIGHRQLTKDAALAALTPSAREQWLQARDPACLTGYETRLRLLIDRCRSLQIECVLATQPVLYGIGVDELTGIDLEAIRVGEVDGAARWELLQRYNQVTKQVGNDLKVPVIDVANKLPKSSRYFYDLTHYNIEGAEKVASIMHESQLIANTQQAALRRAAE